MNEKEKQLHIRMTPEDYKKLKLRCVYEDLSVQDYVSKLIFESLADYSVEHKIVKRSKSPQANR